MLPRPFNEQNDTYLANEAKVRSRPVGLDGISGSEKRLGADQNNTGYVSEGYASLEKH